jgi:small conductance mechanosensitive channel
VRRTQLLVLMVASPVASIFAQAAPDASTQDVPPVQGSAAPPPTAEAAQKAVGLSAEQMQHLIETYGVPALKAIILLILGLLVANWTSSLVRAACERAKFDVTLGRFLSTVVRWLILAAVVIMCLSSFGVQVTSLVALLGTIGVAIGLALQGSLSHIASGVMLLIFRPFKVGDFVTAGGHTGSVEEIGLFSTLLTTLDNRRIIVPNGAIVSSVITNATHFPMRVADVTVQTNPARPLEETRQLIREAAESVQGRVPEKPPGVVLTGMALTNTWLVTVWCKTTEIEAVKERLLVTCNQAIANAGAAPAVPITLVKQI